METVGKIVQSPIGKLWLEASAKGITRLTNDVKGKSDRESNLLPQANIWLVRAEKQLGEYFAGTRTQFDVPLDLKGSVFQIKAWKGIASVPAGKTISYSELAQRVGNSAAVRAAGTACGANPVLLIVPCHRILAKDGSLGGFGAGLPVKKWLLAHEVSMTGLRKAS